MTDPQTSLELRSSPPLAGETVALTGTLASMPHWQALEVIAEHGGQPSRHVSRQTTILVVGEEGWPLEDDGRPSKKLEYALELQSGGQVLRILNESEWLYLVGLNEHRDEVHRVYTPAMLSKLLDVPVERIRSWERAGLIRPVRKVYRLPYFDFQEVTSARKLNELVSAGVAIPEIKTSLTTLTSVFHDAHRALQQLTILTQSPHVVYRDSNGLIAPRTGQRLFDFDSTDEKSDVELENEDNDGPDTIEFRLPEQVADINPQTGEQWLIEGCRLADNGEIEPAIQALRECLRLLPGDPEANFHLADCLYRTGSVAAAIERLYITIEFDDEFVEAWTQLGCLLADDGQKQQALDCLMRAIEIHPDFPDAHWHAANLLEQMGRIDDAITHWNAYLEFDTRGPWAADAADRISELQTAEPASATADTTDVP